MERGAGLPMGAREEETGETRTTDDGEAPPAPRPLEAGGADAVERRTPRGAGRSSARTGCGRERPQPARARPRPRRPPGAEARRPRSWGLTFQWVVASVSRPCSPGSPTRATARSRCSPALRPRRARVRPPADDLGAGAAVLVRRLVPAGGRSPRLAAYFWWRRDRFAVILMVAWAAESLNNVSVYIGDAQAHGAAALRRRRLGRRARLAQHPAATWAGSEPPTRIANVVGAASMVLFVVALGLAALGFVRARRS